MYKKRQLRAWIAIAGRILQLALVQPHLVLYAFQQAPSGNQRPPSLSDSERPIKADIPLDGGTALISATAIRDEMSFAWEPLTRIQPREHSKGTINESLADEAMARWNTGGNGNPRYVSNRIGYHPGTRVIVDGQVSGAARNSGGTLSTTRQLLAELRSLGYWPYRICFEVSARDIPVKAGDTWMHVKANMRGRVTAKLLKSNLEKAQVAECILHATRSITLPHPLPIAASLSLRVRVFPGDAPLAASIDEESYHAVDPDVAREAFGPVQHAIEHCVRDGIKHDPRLWGRLALLLQFDRHGRVMKATERGSHFPDVAVVSCSTSAARELRLPEMAEPRSIVVAVKVGTLAPLVLQPSQ